MTRSAVRGPTDATQIPRYAGPATFARLPRIDEVSSADVAVVGVPFDSGVSYRPGARFGPGHIRASSKLLRPYNPALDVEPFGRTRSPMPATSPSTPSTSARPSRRSRRRRTTFAPTGPNC